MTDHTERKRFYYTAAKQYKTMMAILGLFWGITFIFGAGLRNHSVAVTIMAMSFVYPLVILLSFLQNLKTLNYADVDAEGVSTTYLGLFHRMTRWAEIESMAAVTINGYEAIGVNYFPAYKRRDLSAATSMRIAGYEGLLRQGVAADGQTFTEWANEHLVPSSSRGSKKTGAERRALQTMPVQIRQTFQLNDLWTKPYAIAWAGASLVCVMLADVLRRGNHTLGSVFGLAGIISMSMAGASLVRFRRMADEAHGRQKVKRPNDRSNLT